MKFDKLIESITGGNKIIDKEYDPGNTPEDGETYIFILNKGRIKVSEEDWKKYKIGDIYHGKVE